MHNLEKDLDFYVQQLETTQHLDEWLDGLMKYCEQSKVAASNEWPQIVQQMRQHPLFKAIQECPYHQRAFTKPRGYPGDAVMLDMIYELERGIKDSAHAGATDRGLQLFRAYQRRESCDSVRERKHELARHIRRAADSKPSTRILAIACGHLREAVEVEPDVWSRVDELVAFDQDAESLSVVADVCGQLPVKVMKGRIQDIIKGSTVLTRFDLIYSAGLFDYLDDKAAASLITRIAASLNHGGLALVGNFQYRPEMAYAEVFQDWTLVPRSEKDLIQLASRNLDATRFNTRVFSDRWKSIAWLEIIAVSPDQA